MNSNTVARHEAQGASKTVDGDNSLLARFTAAGVSYTVAARDMGIARSSLHRALHRGDPKTETVIKQWLAARRARSFYRTGRQMGLLQKNGITIAEAAAGLGVGAVELGQKLSSGEWNDEAEFRRFQKWIEDKKEGGKKKMLTKITLPEEVLEFFALKRDPFSNEMEGQDDILDTKELGRAEKKILNAVDKGGWIAVTGPVGSGKSTLIKKVKAKLARRRDVAIVEPRTLEKQYLGASHVCDSILQDLGTASVLTHRTLEHKARLVGRTLEEAYKDNRHVIVLIDEAHLLRPDALLALKRIYEFEIGFKKLLSLVLVGQESLARQLKTNFTLTEVSQRVDLYEIGSLNGSLGAYVQHKLDRAGCAGRELFDRSAYKEIGRHWDTPLMVNNVAAAALLRAHDLGQKTVNAEIVGLVQGGY